jgi:hypothetical protein
MRAVELRKVKEGEYFKRKPDARGEFIRGHYNRRDQWGPATFWCSRAVTGPADPTQGPPPCGPFFRPLFNVVNQAGPCPVVRAPNVPGRVP